LEGVFSSVLRIETIPRPKTSCDPAVFAIILVAAGRPGRLDMVTLSSEDHARTTPRWKLR
jgi:hypothetical protein